jgi:hypothetical protein
MKQSKDFRPFIPTLEYPRVAAFQGRDAYQHGDAGLANPIPQALLFSPWDKLYREPFKGITTNGLAIPGLFELAPNGAPVHLMVNAATSLLDLLSSRPTPSPMFAFGCAGVAKVEQHRDVYLPLMACVSKN